MNNTIKIGKVINTHGLKGEMKVWYDSKEYLNISECLIHNQLYCISSIRGITNNTCIFKLSSVNNIDDATKLKGLDVYIKSNNDGLKIKDIIGLKVYFEDIYRGKIISFVNYGGGDLAEIEYENKLYLFPLLNIKFIKNDLYGKLQHDIHDLLS